MLMMRFNPVSAMAQMATGYVGRNRKSTGGITDEAMSKIKVAHRRPSRSTTGEAINEHTRAEILATTMILPI